MAKQYIKLTTKKELQVFMDSTRQRMIRILEIEGKPITAKHLADIMSITPSSAKYHLTQLENIGLVSVDHTELIHGILATYYHLEPVEVRLGMNESAFSNEKTLIAENLLMTIFSNFTEQIKNHPEVSNDDCFFGDMRTGVLQLTQAEANELHSLIKSYIESHSKPKDGTMPFEFSVLAYRVQPEKNNKES